MVNGISSPHIPYNGYPGNAIGETQVTKDIASTCFDAQRPYIAKTYEFLTTEEKPSYTLPVIGAVVSFLSLIGVAALKLRK